MDPSNNNPSEPPIKPTTAKNKKRASQQNINRTDSSFTNAQAHDQDDSLLGDAGGDGSHISASSNFRNVSACNRCRTRKHRCDQKLPACTSCEKANVRCVGYDPVSKREIPRSYVFYLESRVSNLEAILQANGIAFPPSGNLEIDAGVRLNPEETLVSTTQLSRDITTRNAHESAVQGHLQSTQHDLSKTPASLSLTGFAGLDHRATKSPISFASIVYAAVKKSMSNVSSERNLSRSSKANNGSANGKDSFFGLYSTPTAELAAFPDRDLANRLIRLYFEHSNPQIPTLHRGEFEALLERVYATEPKDRTHRELFLLNIVFAISAGIIMDSPDTNKEGTDTADGPRQKRQRLSDEKYEAEEYHAAALVHLEHFMYSPVAIESTGYGLEDLQAVLLLAGFALLRPTAPGLWYIVGVAIRLAIDLGLHFEDPNDTDIELDRSSRTKTDSRTETGRKQWVRDMRRRLWYCTYSFDRLVAVCVGRPVSIPDTVITTEFPTLLDDKDITPQGFDANSALSIGGPVLSYKHVSHHYFRLRLLQSEILQVLQHRQAQMAVAAGKTTGNPFIIQGLQTPFLSRFPSFQHWRADVDRRLWEWMQSAPSRDMTGVGFNPLFLELNYWQAVVMIYRHSLTAPAPLAGELDDSTGEEAKNAGPISMEDKEDEQMVFLKVAEAGQRVLRIYRQLHRMHLVNYTYLATHHLFVCGISFLYAIWHSPRVRSRLTIDDVDFTVLAATSVLSDLTAKCPPAEACRDAFKRMSKATVSMCMATTGFGADAARYVPQQEFTPESTNMNPQEPDPISNPFGLTRPLSQQRPPPHFDTGFKDLFSDADLALRSPVDEVTRNFPNPKTNNRRRRVKSERMSISNMAGQSSNASTSYMPDPESTLDPSLRAGTGTASYTSSPADGSNIESQAYDPFGALDFLDASTFPAQEQSGAFSAGDFGQAGNDGSGGTNWDFGFGASGLAFDAGASGSGWDGDLDILGGFYFGGNGKAS